MQVISRKLQVLVQTLAIRSCRIEGKRQRRRIQGTTAKSAGTFDDGSQPASSGFTPNPVRTTFASIKKYKSQAETTSVGADARHTPLSSPRKLTPRPSLGANEQQGSNLPGVQPRQVFLDHRVLPSSLGLRPCAPAHAGPYEPAPRFHHVASRENSGTPSPMEADREAASATRIRCAARSGWR